MYIAIYLNMICTYISYAVLIYMIRLICDKNKKKTRLHLAEAVHTIMLIRVIKDSIEDFSRIPRGAFY